MKKLLLAAFALAAFTASAYANCKLNGAQLYCNWDSGCPQVGTLYSNAGTKCSDNPSAEGCGKTCATKVEECISWGALYTGVTYPAGDYEGKGKTCSSLGGQTSNGSGTISGDSGLEFCDWGPEANGEGGCHLIENETKRSECSEYGYISTSPTCADGPTANGLVKYCDWGEEGGCHKVMGNAAIAKCTEDYGTVVDVCPTNRPTQSSPSNDPCTGANWTNPGCPGYIAPIITLPTPFSGNALIAMQNAVNLQVKGTATLRIYDMKGKALSSQMIEQGNHVVSLQLPRGLYIIKATSGSWKQTVKVTVK